MIASSTVRSLALALGCALSGVAAAQPVSVPAPTPIPAQPQVTISTSHAEAARELLTVTRTLEPFNQILPNVMRQVSNALTSTNIDISADPAKRAALEEALRDIERGFEGERDQLLAGMAVLYAARFSEEELRQMVEFFRSPVGQKYVQLTPVIAQEAINSANQWAQRVGQGAFTRVREEMRRRGHPIN
jgi:hypothetical protein